MAKRRNSKPPRRKYEDGTYSCSRKVTEDTPLTPFEQKVIIEYIKSGVGSEAVRRADAAEGYERTAYGYRNTAKNVLRRPNVQKEISRIMSELKKETVASADEVMSYFTSVMRGEVKDQFGLEAPLAERTKAAQEIARRTIDIDNKLKLKEAEENQAPIQITLNWAKPDE